MASRLVLLVCLVCSVSTLSAAGPEESADRPPPDSREEIEPADVYVRVARLRGEIELIRDWLDKPANTQPALQIRNAAPREVFYQAVTLFRKVDRLSFELTRRSAVVPPLPAKAIRPQHVREVINQTIIRVQNIKKHAGVETVVEEPARDPKITSTDVFQSIMHANRQVNLMLEKQLSPSDVYQQITLAVGYTARLRAAFPGRRIPETPVFEPDKTPSDVHHVLVQSFEVVRAVAGTSNIEILELHEPPHKDETPSDTYDIVSLLVSELAFLHRQLEGAKPPRPVVYPGVKVPSDVFQRARLLHAQLIELRHRVDQAPDWLTKKRAP